MKRQSMNKCILCREIYWCLCDISCFHSLPCIEGINRKYGSLIIFVSTWSYPLVIYGPRMKGSHEGIQT